MSTQSLKAKLLLAMALSDGHFDTKELEMLADRAMWWGISAEEFDEIIENPEISDEESGALPESKEERAELFSELILMAFADGKLEAAELEVLIKLGVYLDVTEETVRSICEQEAKTFGIDTPDEL